ncbi:MAG TPA: (2Fe-2S)-binding protein [Holophaga sp.]|nr:(2Fe-2S)-binding protein [Holophaga sp.]
MPPIRLIVNGRARTLQVGPDVPLLRVLREDLRLTGTPFGCGTGVCGACAVLLDGVPARSCQVTAAEAEGRAVTTVEGLGAERIRLQRAWFLEDVAPCGACRPAMVLAAAGLLRGNPDPSDRDIDRAFEASRCHCGTLSRVRGAVRRAARGGA